VRISGKHFAKKAKNPKFFSEPVSGRLIAGALGIQRQVFTAD
jgi:hypothetical protein